MRWVRVTKRLGVVRLGKIKAWIAPAVIEMWTGSWATLKVRILASV